MENRQRVQAARLAEETAAGAAKQERKRPDQSQLSEKDDVEANESAGDTTTRAKSHAVEEIGGQERVDKKKAERVVEMLMAVTRTVFFFRHHVFDGLYIW